jgi:hypothetical protein
MRSTAGRDAGVLALLAVVAVGLWSLAFRPTYAYPFFWDDLHFIRSYTAGELLSTFHGPNDPDGIETPALRPVATLLFHVQGRLLGERVGLQRAFMAVVMAAFLWNVGLLLRETGLGLAHVALVLGLFASSRAFASLILWLTLGSVIVAYAFMVFAARIYLRWTDRGRAGDLAALSLSAALAAFCREGAYVLPIALPLLWLLARWPSRRTGLRALAGAVTAAAVVGTHYALRQAFIQRPVQPRFSLEGWGRVWTSALSAATPGGVEVWGRSETLARDAWWAFLALLLVGLLIPLGAEGRVSRDPLLGIAGACSLGFLLCTPSLAIARSFGVGLAAVAFLTAVSIAVVEVVRRSPPRSWARAVILAVTATGVAIGVAGGVRRSREVADSLHENCASKVLRDGQLLFDGGATIPRARRRAGLARLAELGIRSRDDLESLARDMHHPREYFRRQASHAPLFLPRHDYLSF